MNKKGFTLVELLAVILLVSLLLGVAIPTVVRYIKKGTKSYYTSLESELKVAGADYVETYRSLLPQNIGHVRVIELSELVSNKYIDPVVDEKGNNCTGQVTVKKINTDSYEYYSCLRCGTYYTSKEANCDFSEYENVYADSGDYEIRVPKTYYEVEQTKDFIAPLASVYYKGEQIKNDLVGNPSKLDTNKVGTYDIIYYYHGVTKTIQVKVKDNVKPSKTQVVLKYTNSSGKSYKGNWFSGNIYVAYKATDYTKEGIKGSGIDHYEVSTDGTNFIKLSNDDVNKYKPLSSTEQLMIVEGNYVRYVRAIDKSGNVGPVNSYRIKIDKTVPTCSLEVKSGTKYGDWYNTSITVGFKATSGTISNVASSSIDVPSITSPIKAKVVTGTLTDEAGNVNTCKITVNVDNKKPSVPTITADDGKRSGLWHKANFKLSYSGADNISGNLYYYKVDAENTVTNGRANGTNATSSSISTETASTTYYALVCSTAGLCSGNSNYLVKLDKTAPTCSLEVKSGTKSGNWYNTDITVGFKSTDGTVGQVATSSIDYPKVNVPVQGKLITGTLTDEAGNTNTCTLTVNVDNKKPNPPAVVASDNKSSGTWHNSIFYLNASGANNISGNTYYYGTGTAPTSTNNEVSTNTTGTTYYTRVCSGSGLCSDPTGYYVMLDRTAPTLSNLSNSSGGGWVHTDITVAYDISNNLSGIQGCYYKYAYSPSGCQSSWCGTSYSKNGNRITPSNYSAERDTKTYVMCKSVAGLESNVLETNIRIDKTWPAIWGGDMTLGTQNYNFTSNVATSCGISGCSVTCNPASSLKTGIYTVTCSIASNAGLYASTSFQVKHSYNASYCSKTCTGKEECNCGNKPNCPCGYGTCNPWGCPDWNSECVREHGGSSECGCTQYTNQQCCGGEPPACNETTEWKCDKCPDYDCSYYYCPDGGSLSGTVCNYDNGTPAVTSCVQ